MFRHRERPAARQRLEQEQEHRTVDDELGDNDRKRGNVPKGENQGSDTGLDHQPRVAPSQPNRKRYSRVPLLYHFYFVIALF